MELGEYLAALRKGLPVILLLALLGGALGYGQAVATTPTYRSSSTVFLSLTRAETVSELNQGATYTQNLVQSFVQLARLPVVLDPVIEGLGLDVTPNALAGTIQVDSPLNTQLIEISAVSPDPQRAADVANAVAASLAENVTALAPTSADGAAALRLSVVAEARPSRFPFSPAPRRDAAAGLVLGVALGVLVALVRAQLDTRVRTAKDLSADPARATLGQVPLTPLLVKHPRAVLADPHSVLAESYRRVAANLQFLDASRPLRAMVVSSTVPGEGKSTTAINLALVMAEKRASVLLVDADLRSPSVAEMCGLEAAAGLSTVLGNQATIDDVVQHWGVPNLHVIAAGQIPPNPSQLIDSEAMDKFLASATSTYDLVIIDTPPLLALTDGAVLARKTDGAVVVARSRKVRRPQLTEALASIDALGATCLGVVLNGIPTQSHLRYGYGHVPHRRGLFGRHRARASVPPPAHAAPPHGGLTSPRAPAVPSQHVTAEEERPEPSAAESSATGPPAVEEDRVVEDGPSDLEETTPVDAAPDEDLEGDPREPAVPHAHVASQSGGARKSTSTEPRTEDD